MGFVRIILSLALAYIVLAFVGSIWVSSKSHEFLLNEVQKIAENCSGDSFEQHSFLDNLRTNLTINHTVLNDAPLSLSTGGLRGSVHVLYVSFTEFLAVYHAPIRTNGDTGRHFLHLSILVLKGQVTVWNDRRGLAIYEKPGLSFPDNSKSDEESGEIAPDGKATEDVAEGDSKNSSNDQKLSHASKVDFAADTQALDKAGVAVSNFSKVDDENGESAPDKKGTVEVAESSSATFTAWFPWNWGSGTQEKAEQISPDNSKLDEENGKSASDVTETQGMADGDSNNSSKDQELPPAQEVDFAKDTQAQNKGLGFPDNSMLDNENGKCTLDERPEGHSKDQEQNKANKYTHGIGHRSFVELRSDTYLLIYGRGLVPLTMGYWISDTIFSSLDPCSALLTIGYYFKAVFSSLAIGRFFTSLYDSAWGLGLNGVSQLPMWWENAMNWTTETSGSHSKASVMADN